MQYIMEKVRLSAQSNRTMFMQFMQYSKCIKCIKSRLIVSKKAFSFYVLSTSFLRLFYVMCIWRYRDCILCIFFVGGGSCFEKDITKRICSSAKPITTRDDKEFCSSHRLSLRYGTQCAKRTCLTLHVSTRFHKSTVLSCGLCQTDRGRGRPCPRNGICVYRIHNFDAVALKKTIVYLYISKKCSTFAQVFRISRI